LPDIRLYLTAHNILASVEQHCIPDERGLMNNPMEAIRLDSTDPQAVGDLVMSLMQSEAQAYTVLNEDQEDITHEVRKLVSLQARMRKGR